MAANFFLIASCLAVFSATNAQLINRVLPNFGVPINEAVVPLPNQVFFNSPLVPTVAPNFIPTVSPNLVNFELPCGVETILSAPVTVPGTTTIIQDSTVANNLANALQLLVVSNLLSQTLPSMGSPDLLVPGYGAVDLVQSLPLNLPGYLPAVAGLPAGYSYVY